MAYEQRDNSGTLFRNDKREKDTHPNATGTALIDGVLYEVSAWTKDGRGGKFQSLSFKRKEQRPQPRQDYASASGGLPATSYDDQEIPF